MAVLYAIHRFSGIATPANAAFSAKELEHQLKSSGATGLFTSSPLLETALEAAKGAGIPREKVFVIPVPGFEGKKTPFPTVEELIKEGGELPELEPLRWVKGQGARQPAFLCYSSGTSGLPVSHGDYGYRGRVANLRPESSDDISPECYCQCDPDVQL